VNVLEIEAATWVPSESIPGAANTRRLGLMLNRVQVKRSLPPMWPARPGYFFGGDDGG